MRIQNSTFKIQNVSSVNKLFSALLAFVVCLVVLLPANAQLNSGAQQNVTGTPGTFLIRGARIIPVVGAEIENGSVLIRNGKIEAVGANVPSAGATIIEGRGLRVYPGMIDAATNMGLIEIPQGAPGTVDVNETGGVNPNAKAIVAINPHSAHVNVTRVNGTTAVLSMPGGGLISGQSAVINLVGSTPYEMAVNENFSLVINFPRVAVFGGFGGFGQQVTVSITETIRNRDRQVDGLKQWFADAEAYGKAMDAAAQDSKLPRPRTNLKLAAMVPYVRGLRPILFSADREVDIRGVIKFADDMKIKAIILGGNDSWKVTKELKEKNIPVILTGTFDLPVSEDAPYDINYETPSKLQKAGVQFCVATGDFGAEARDLPYRVGMAAAFGLPPMEALKSVTIYPAQILGVSDKMGSIEAGKVANLVVTDGDLLEARTNIKYLFINGRQIPLTSRHTELYNQFKDRIK